MFGMGALAKLCWFSCCLLGLCPCRVVYFGRGFRLLRLVVWIGGESFILCFA